MPQSTSILSSPFIDTLKVWVLAPHLESSDTNIDYYYDFSQSIAEYTRAFGELGINWVWQPVNMNDYGVVIDRIYAEKEQGEYFPLVFNLCDGDEINGTPGVSVIRTLEEKGIPYTGADDYFYEITTSKIPMKQAFDKYKVPTAKWEAIHSPTQDTNGIFKNLGSPVIVKPSVSGGSMGLGIKNVVHNGIELKEQVDKMFAGYRNWNLTTDGIVAESFINGAEYTILIVGSYDDPDNAIIYTPVERVFHPSLPDHEKILSFDRLWEIYDEESAMPEEGNFYEYEMPDRAMMDELKKISWDAYVATKGRGYTRVDLRRDNNTGKIYVLEVNAQCGLSEDEDYTSIGAILRMSGKTFSELVVAIIHDAFSRKAKKQRKRRYA
jgi:D-alanine-D-alanine ligase